MGRKNHDDIPDESVSRFNDVRYDMLQDYTKFPWSWFGFDYPSWGSVHSYLCSYLAPYCDIDVLIPFCKAKPSLFEVKRASTEYNSRMLMDIINYCEKINENLQGFDKIITAREVHKYLIGHHEFQETFDFVYKTKYLKGDV